jgi:hypothetical protein
LPPRRKGLPSASASLAARPLEAERLAEDKIRQREHKKRLRALHKEAVEAARRQKKLLRELGVPDLSPEEVAERARRGAYR